MTRDRLVGLTFQSLYRLAAQHGVDVSPDQSKDEVIDAILEAIEESRIERESANNHSVNMMEKKYDLSVIEQFDDGAVEDIELPEAYNITRIVLMLRDPSWAFTYWDVRERDVAAVSSGASFEGFSIRVCKYDNSEDTAVDCFDIPVSVSDNRWYIYLPDQDARYRVSLVATLSSGEHELARSNPVYVPPATVHTEVSDDSDALLLASGVDQMELAAFDAEIPQRIIARVGD